MPGPPGLVMANPPNSPRRPSHATVVAYLALFVALGGTAGALAGKNTVDSRDIKPKAVRATDLAKGAVTGAKLRAGAVSADKVLDGSLGQADLGPASVGTGELALDSVAPDKLDLFRSSRTNASVPITGSGPQPVGPEITLNFPPGGLVVLYAEADIATNNNATECRLRVRIGTFNVSLIEADPDSSNPPILFKSPLVPFLIEPGSPTGPVTIALNATLNGDTGGTCTYVNPELWGFTVG